MVDHLHFSDWILLHPACVEGVIDAGNAADAANRAGNAGRQAAGGAGPGAGAGVARPDRKDNDGDIDMGAGPVQPGQPRSRPPPFAPHADVKDEQLVPPPAPKLKKTHSRLNPAGHWCAFCLVCFLTVHFNVLCCTRPLALPEMERIQTEIISLASQQFDERCSAVKTVDEAEMARIYDEFMVRSLLLLCALCGTCCSRSGQSSHHVVDSGGGQPLVRCVP